MVMRGEKDLKERSKYKGVKRDTRSLESLYKLEEELDEFSYVTLVVYPLMLHLFLFLYFLVTYY